MEAGQYLPGIGLDVRVTGVLRDPLNLPQDLKIVRPEHDPVEGVVLVLVQVEAKSDGSHVEVGQESHTAEELVLGFVSGHEVGELLRTLGSQQVRDVVVIAGEID